MKKFIVALILFISSFFAQSAILVGNTVIISYNSQNSLFGTPILIGDKLSFSPNNFFAIDNQITSATFTFNLKSKDGFNLSNFDYHESGYYLNNGVVITSGQVRVKSLDPLTPVNTSFLMMTDSTTHGSLINWSGSTTHMMHGKESQITIENVLYASHNSIIQKNYVELNFGSIGTNPSTVPEPSTLILILLSFVSLIVFKKKFSIL